MLSGYMASYGWGQTRSSTSSDTLRKATVSCIKPGKTDGLDFAAIVTISSLASFGDSFAMKVKKG